MNGMALLLYAHGTGRVCSSRYTHCRWASRPSSVQKRLQQTRPSSLPGACRLATRVRVGHLIRRHLRGVGGARAFFDPPLPLCFWFSSVIDLKLTPSSQSGGMYHHNNDNNVSDKVCCCGCYCVASALSVF